MSTFHKEILVWFVIESVYDMYVLFFICQNNIYKKFQRRYTELLSTMTTARKVTPSNDPVECVDQPPPSNWFTQVWNVQIIKAEWHVSLQRKRHISLQSRNKVRRHWCLQMNLFLQIEIHDSFYFNNCRLFFISWWIMDYS